MGPLRSSKDSQGIPGIPALEQDSQAEAVPRATAADQRRRDDQPSSSLVQLKGKITKAQIKKNERTEKDKQEQKRQQYLREVQVLEASSEEEGRPGSSGLDRSIEAPAVENVCDQQPGQPFQDQPYQSAAAREAWQLAPQAAALDQLEAVQILASTARARGARELYRRGEGFEAAVPCMISSCRKVFAPNLGVRKPSSPD